MTNAMNIDFLTKRLQFAVYLHASGLLKYLRAEPNGDGKVRFVFRDDERRGSEIEFQFDRGATVSARDLFSSQTFLRRQMSEAIENRTNGERSNEHTDRSAR